VRNWWLPNDNTTRIRDYVWLVANHDEIGLPLTPLVDQEERQLLLALSIELIGDL